MSGVMKRIAREAALDKLTMEDIVEALKGPSAKDIEQSLALSYHRYKCTTRAKNPKSIKAFIKDLMVSHNKDVASQVKPANPATFMKLVDMLYKIQEWGEDKDLKYVKPICEKLNNNQLPSDRQQSVVSAIWMKCLQREQEAAEKKERNAQKHGILGALAE